MNEKLVRAARVRDTAEAAAGIAPALEQRPILKFDNATPRRRQYP